MEGKRIGFFLKMDHKERNFGNASSVNFEFSFSLGVHIASYLHTKIRARLIQMLKNMYFTTPYLIASNDYTYFVKVELRKNFSG